MKIEITRTAPKRNAAAAAGRSFRGGPRCHPRRRPVQSAAQAPFDWKKFKGEKIELFSSRARAGPATRYHKESRT